MRLSVNFQGIICATSIRFPTGLIGHSLSCKFLQLSDSDLGKIDMLKYKALLCPESERFDDADGERCIRLWSSFGGQGVIKVTFRVWTPFFCHRACWGFVRDDIVVT